MAARSTGSAVFEPHGSTGQLCWAAIYPYHGLVFGGMVRNVAHAADLRTPH
jgi:hypothetical protein